MASVRHHQMEMEQLAMRMACELVLTREVTAAGKKSLRKVEGQMPMNHGGSGQLRDELQAATMRYEPQATWRGQVTALVLHAMAKCSLRGMKRHAPVSQNGLGWLQAELWKERARHGHLDRFESVQVQKNVEETHQEPPPHDVGDVEPIPPVFPHRMR